MRGIKRLNDSRYLKGNQSDRALPIAVSVISESSWHENIQLRITKALKTMTIDATETIETVRVTRLNALRGSGYQIGQGRYTLDQCAFEVMRRVESKDA